MARRAVHKGGMALGHQLGETISINNIINTCVFTLIFHNFELHPLIWSEMCFAMLIAADKTLASVSNPARVKTFVLFRNRRLTQR